VVVQSTSGALPAVGTLPQDRQALETPAPDPVADGIALTGLASPSLPPLPGNQRTGGTARTGSTSRTSGTGTGTGGTPTATGTGPRGALGTGPRSALGTGPTGTDPQAAVAGQRRFTPPSPTKGGRAALMATFVALTLAAVAIGFYVVRSAVHTESVPPPVPGRAAPSAVVPGPAGPGPAGSGPAGSPGSAPGGTSALIDPQGFTGRAADAALGELRNAGLVPSVVTTTGGPPPRPAACVVTGLQPAGTLARGTAVTVTCIQR
jgi:serine/threonine-protein kinase